MDDMDSSKDFTIYVNSPGGSVTAGMDPFCIAGLCIGSSSGLLDLFCPSILFLLKSAILLSFHDLINSDILTGSSFSMIPLIQVKVSTHRPYP